jgi:hypothetical protein
VLGVGGTLTQHSDSKLIVEGQQTQINSLTYSRFFNSNTTFFSLLPWDRLASSRVLLLINFSIVDSSLGYRDSSLGYRDSSLGYRDSSLGYRDSSLGYRDSD